VPDLLDTRWDVGAKDCSTRARPPLEMHRYDDQTFVLRESLCATWEAPFMYLLVGAKRALLIDTGDVADPGRMPLASTITGLLAEDPHAKMPLVVVHSHTHLDHCAGDPQFENLPGVQLIPADLDHVRKYFGFAGWPDGVAQVDLGDRVVDVLAAPGHSLAHLVYYDRNTGILFTGDFLLPGRLLVEDIDAYQASAERVGEFVRNRPVRVALGGHIEKDHAGELLPWQSTHHPDERPLPLPKADVLALPAALRGFNGLYSESGGFVIMNPNRVIAASAIAILVLAYSRSCCVGSSAAFVVDLLEGTARTCSNPRLRLRSSALADGNLRGRGARPYRAAEVPLTHSLEQA
jgi:glyoxylase-like metal-dependent hydrolase (beta-lactamase superfamily II)